MNDVDKSKFAYEHALMMNPSSIQAILNLGSILQEKSQYLQALELYQRAIAILDGHHAMPSAVSVNKGEVWAALGFCALMLDDLPKSYTAYQQALLNLGTVLDPMIWYGIGLLYDRYGSDEHALEAFGLAVKLLEKSKAVIAKHPKKLTRDIYYRLGVLFRIRKRFDMASKCFKYVAEDPPAGLATDDLKLQLAIVDAARGTPEGISDAKSVLEELLGSPDSNNKRKLKAECHLAWINAHINAESSLAILKSITEVEKLDPLCWYFLGRIYFSHKQPVRAYEAYQQAVYRDSRNAAYWNSVGILYFEAQQYRDALDAFSRAIQYAPMVADIWWNLGVLYESCNSQLNDAADAYQRASELDPGCDRIIRRLSRIRSILAEQPCEDDNAGKPVVIELDPLSFMQRSVFLNELSLPNQHPIIQLPPPPIQKSHESIHQHPNNLPSVSRNAPHLPIPRPPVGSSNNNTALSSSNGRALNH